MKTETILEVMNELVGITEPYGETNIDKTVYNNQEKVIEMVDDSINKLIQNVEFKDRAEYSMQQIGKRAYEALKELNETINEALGIVEE